VTFVCKWTELALQDLLNIEDYIAQDNPQASIEVTIRIVRTVETQLIQFPLSGKTGRLPSTRELVINGTPYIAAYYVKNKTVEVLRVLHTAQKWPSKI